MINSIFVYQYMQNAIYASILASLVCGIIGVIIVEKKLVLMSGGIAHTAYGGVGLGYLLGIEPLIGAFFFSVLASLGIGYIKRKGGARQDVIIGMFWSLGMSLGILFLALSPGYPPDISSYLFGNILTVTRDNLKLITLLAVFVILVVVILFNNWKAYLFDDEFAFIIGIKTAFLEYLLMILVAMTIVVLIRVAGIILVLALLTTPAAASSLISSNLKNRMIISIILGNIFCITGLWVAYTFNLASGASIVVISVLIYFFMYVIKQISKKGSVKNWIMKRN